MSMLNEKQRAVALEAMEKYLAHAGMVEKEAGRDIARHELIKSTLGPLLNGYLAGNVDLPMFRSQIDSINKRHEHWGFKGIKGQMFFNMLLNTASDLSDCDAELKAALEMPENESVARSRMRTFASYVTRLGEEFVAGGGSAYGKPKVGSVPFFISYFWQIHGPDIWPVYYTNSVTTMVDMNLWRPPEDLAEAYLEYKHIWEELQSVYSEASGQTFSVYDVEHVFWFHGENPYTGKSALEQERLVIPDVEAPTKTPPVEIERLPESYVPPIVAVLPGMARHEPAFVSAAEAAGTSLPRAFEKSIDAAFRIIGYETKLLGQGQGRVPDGQVVDVDNSYAILWDAKVREHRYTLGTDDRTIRDYIGRMSRELKRRSMRNIYYVIVSSEFADDFDDSIRLLKMETDVSEVCLMEAEALVAMVETKLRDPLHVSLGPDGLQRLYTKSGILTVSAVREMMG